MYKVKGKQAMSREELMKLSTTSYARVSHETQLQFVVINVMMSFVDM